MRHRNTIDTAGRGSYDTGHLSPPSPRFTQRRGGNPWIGAFVGAATFLALEERLSLVIDAWPIVLGAIFSAFVLFLPKGIWGTLTGGIHGRQSA